MCKENKLKFEMHAKLTFAPFLYYKIHNQGKTNFCD